MITLPSLAATRARCDDSSHRPQNCGQCVRAAKSICGMQLSQTQPQPQPQPQTRLRLQLAANSGQLYKASDTHTQPGRAGRLADSLHVAFPSRLGNMLPGVCCQHAMLIARFNDSPSRQHENTANVNCGPNLAGELCHNLLAAPPSVRKVNRHQREKKNCEEIMPVNGLGKRSAAQLRSLISDH